jgi:hypothetical protein
LAISPTDGAACATNDLPFVVRVLGLLESEGIRAWIFGGWAEELHGLRPRGAHSDVDLLYPAPAFGELDEVVARCGLDEVRAKRSAFKRAFVLDGVVVELFLVRRDAHGWTTPFAGYDHRWPHGLLSSRRGLRVACVAAVTGYRRAYSVRAAAARR